MSWSSSIRTTKRKRNACKKEMNASTQTIRGTTHCNRQLKTDTVHQLTWNSFIWKVYGEFAITYWFYLFNRDVNLKYSTSINQNSRRMFTKPTLKNPKKRTIDSDRTKGCCCCCQSNSFTKRGITTTTTTPYDW